jgi:hypothetical protein
MPLLDGGVRFWTETVGASLAYPLVTGAADAVGFFTQAAERLAAVSAGVDA